MDRVTQAYLRILERNLSALEQGTAVRRPQDHRLATYTCKRQPEDNSINWGLSTDQIYNLIRAVSDPYPGAVTTLNAQPLRIWSAQLLDTPPRYVGRIPGRVASVHPGDGTVVLTGDGALKLLLVQLEGGPRVCASDILNRLSQTLGAST
jgi:methionyl-tRNA formyltransferase